MANAGIWCEQGDRVTTYCQEKHPKLVGIQGQQLDCPNDIEGVTSKLYKAFLLIKRSTAGLQMQEAIAYSIDGYDERQSKPMVG